MKFCHFVVTPQPEQYEFAVRCIFDDTQCCGKPATFSITLEGIEYPLCAEHYDAIELSSKQDTFAGEDEEWEPFFD